MDTFPILLVTVVTLAVITALGLWYSHGRIESVEDLVSARNRSGSGATTATIIASGMGAWILFSPAEAGASFGGISAIFGYAIGSAIPLFLFIYIGSRVRQLIREGHTLTEYVFIRYGRVMYSYVLIVTVFYMFIFLAAEMTGIAGALALIAGIPPWQTAILIGGFVLIYTTYGGLIASIFTDTIQTIVILPLIVISFGAAVIALGGSAAMYSAIVSSEPQLLDPSNTVGIEFGGFVMIAILAANMFNQGLWQRIFAARDTNTVRRSFGIAAVAVIPMILLPGLFGIVAAGLGLVQSPGDASIAFFLLLNEIFPTFVVLGVVLLVVLLVMSTADTMFTAIASIVTADLPLLVDDPDRRFLMLAARGLTIIVGGCAIYVGAQGYSVLELFLFADLLAAATVFPFLYGLYSTRATQGGVLISSILALIVGLAYFPFSYQILIEVPYLPAILPSSPSFLLAFAGAAAISIVLTIGLSYTIKPANFDHSRLNQEIRSLDDLGAVSTESGNSERRHNNGDNLR